METKKTAPQVRGAVGRTGCKSARVIQVIEVRTKVGSGTEKDPNRIVTEYWSLDGKLLAVNDPEVNQYGHQLSHH